MNEKLSYTEYVVVGSPRQYFDIGFEDYHEDKDMLKLTVDNKDITEAGYSVVRNVGNTLEFTPAIPVGAVVRIQRVTDIDAPFYIFTAGNAFVPSNVDQNFKQVLHSQQEVRDRQLHLEERVIPVVDGLNEALSKADEASKAAQEAAKAASDAAVKVINTVRSTDNIQTLKARVGMVTGDITYVKSYHKPTNLALAQPYMGGGYFVYDAAKASVLDHVVVFNGWVRKCEGSLDVTDGGAIPDLPTAQHTEIARTFEASRQHDIRKLTFRNGVYIIGSTTQGLGDFLSIYGIPPTDLHIQNGYIIEGNNSTLKVIDGVRYGKFGSDVLTPFNSILSVSSCTDVKIKNLIIDGNKQKAVLGGTVGDHGWQVPCYGIRLTSAIRANISDVVVKNMLLDGMYIGASTGTTPRQDIKLDGVALLNNTRQGLTIAGCIGLTATNCQFNYTGQDGIYSAPSAGIDFENEQAPVKDCTFIGCTMRGNMGNDLHIYNVGDFYDMANLVFYGCNIVAEGKTANPFGEYDPLDNKSNAIQINLTAHVAFNDCLIGGKVQRIEQGTDWATELKNRAVFNNCFFTNAAEYLNYTLEVPKYRHIIEGVKRGIAVRNSKIHITDLMIDCSINSEFVNNLVEFRFTKRMLGANGATFDFKNTVEFSNNKFQTYDNVNHNNIILWDAWDNTTNTLSNYAAPSACTWAKGFTGKSGDLVDNSRKDIIGGTHWTAFINDPRIPYKRFVFKGVKCSETYGEVWGTATFEHFGGGEGTLMIYASNYNGVILSASRAGNVWSEVRVVN